MLVLIIFDDIEQNGGNDCNSDRDYKASKKRVARKMLAQDKLESQK